MSDAAAEIREKHRDLIAFLTERACAHAREFDHMADQAIDLAYRKTCFDLFDTAFHAARMGAALTERLSRGLEREPADPEAERPRTAAQPAAFRPAEPQREREREPVTLELFLQSLTRLDRETAAFCGAGLGIPEPPAFTELRAALAGARAAVALPASAPTPVPAPDSG